MCGLLVGLVSHRLGGQTGIIFSKSLPTGHPAMIERFGRQVIDGRN